MGPLLAPDDEQDVIRLAGERAAGGQAMNRRRLFTDQGGMETCRTELLCPLWVISGHMQCNSRCLLCPRKQTFAGANKRPPRT